MLLVQPPLPHLARRSAAVRGMGREEILTPPKLSRRPGMTALGSDGYVGSRQSDFDRGGT
jgi:hypothetical protein